MPNSMILQSNRVRKINQPEGSTAVASVLTAGMIQRGLKIYPSLDIFIINTHGDLSSNGSHTIEVQGGYSWIYASTETFFLNFSNIQKPITVCLFSDYASAACTKQIVEKLPKGSIIGFYAPKKDVFHVDVSHKMINKFLTGVADGKSREEMLWQIAPFCQSHIAYHHPLLGFQSIELPSASFDYQAISSTADLLTLKSASLHKYNEFLSENNLPIITPLLINQIHWYKDLWFMQMVMELCRPGMRQTQAISYLKDVNSDLLLHAMHLVDLQEASHLLDYFLFYYHPKKAPHLQVVVESLEPVFSRILAVTLMNDDLTNQPFIDDLRKQGESPFSFATSIPIPLLPAPSSSGRCSPKPDELNSKIPSWQCT